MLTDLKKNGAFRTVFKKKVKKSISHRNFKKGFDLGRVLFLARKKYEKAKHQGICPSFGGNMPEAQV